MSSGIRTRHHRRTRRAFTLMEIIVVVTIIAILASLIVPRIWRRVGEAKETAAQSECRLLAEQVYAYLIDAGMSSVPDDFSLDLLLLAADDGGGTEWPYLNNDDDIIDPWGNPFDIIVPGNENYDFDIVSYGSDGQQGGEGENADITN